MAGKTRQPRVRRQPQRTCVACRLVEGKRSLVRIVRTPDGTVELDPTGKRSGRGAYLHASRECVQKGLTSGILGRALKVELDPDRKQELQARLMEQMPSE